VWAGSGPYPAASDAHYGYNRGSTIVLPLRPDWRGAVPDCRRGLSPNRAALSTPVLCGFVGHGVSGGTEVGVLSTVSLTGPSDQVVFPLLLSWLLGSVPMWGGHLARYPWRSDRLALALSVINLHAREPEVDSIGNGALT
jgi:hypothetical protein